MYVWTDRPRFIGPLWSVGPITLHLFCQYYLWLLVKIKEVFKLHEAVYSWPKKGKDTIIQ